MPRWGKWKFCQNNYKVKNENEKTNFSKLFLILDSANGGYLTASDIQKGATMFGIKELSEHELTCLFGTHNDEDKPARLEYTGKAY